MFLDLLFDLLFNRPPRKTSGRLFDFGDTVPNTPPHVVVTQKSPETYYDDWYEDDIPF